MLGKRNKILAQKAEERAKALVETAAPQVADSIAEPAEEFKTPVKKKRKRKKSTKKDQ